MHLYTTNNVSRHFLNMERSNFHSPSVNVPTAQNQRWMGTGDVAAKCRTLFLTRIHLQGTREGTATASWLQAWGLIGTLTNPLPASRYPITLSYIRACAIDMAYTTPLGQD